MNATPLGLPGMLLLDRVIHEDARGSFSVLWNRQDAVAAGITGDFIQDNLITTRRGTLRGLHFQTRQPQGKLLTVLAGEVYEAVADLRPSSPTFGRAEGFVLRAAEGRSVWLPPGFAHGFLALSEEVVYLYKVTAPWDPDHAYVLAWDDPGVAVDWPLEPGQRPVLSERDRSGMSWAEVRKLVA